MEELPLANSHRHVEPSRWIPIRNWCSEFLMSVYGLTLTVFGKWTAFLPVDWGVIDALGTSCREGESNQLHIPLPRNIHVLIIEARVQRPNRARTLPRVQLLVAIFVYPNVYLGQMTADWEDIISQTRALVGPSEHRWRNMSTDVTMIKICKKNLNSH